MPQPIVAPGLTTDGAATVMGTSSPFVRSDAVPVGILDYTLIGSGQAVEDSDGDGFVNNTDNCRVRARTTRRTTAASTRAFPTAAATPVSAATAT